MTPIEPDGFRFHLRHLLIVVVFFAILLGIFTPIARAIGAHGVLSPPLLLLLVSPWLLGVLILILERKGPLKFWAAPLLLSLIAPALAMCHNWLVVESWLRLQTVPNLLVTLVLNIVLVGTFTLFVAKMCPNRCPECQKWAMIPLRSLMGIATRTPTTRWCASCGARYWKTSQGELKKERRRTWLDLARTESTRGGRRTRSNFDPDSRAFSPILSNDRVDLLVLPAEGQPRTGLAGNNDLSAHACRPPQCGA